MFKNIFITALFLATFLKNVNGMAVDRMKAYGPEISRLNLYQMCLDKACQHILNYSPEQLFELAEAEIANNISKVLIAENFTLFFPMVKGYPKEIQNKFRLNDEHIDFDSTISPDHTKILSTGKYTAELLDSHRKLLITFQHDGYVLSTKFSPDSTQVLTASEDKTAKLWNLNGDKLTTFRHNDQVNSAEFSRDGKYVLTASNDGTAKLWDLNGTPLATFQHDKDVFSAVFSPDGTHVFTAAWAKLWEINPIWNSQKYRKITTKLWEIHPLWNSKKYRNGQLSLQELATVLLILKHKAFVQSNSDARDVVEEVLNKIDDPVDGVEIVREKQRHIKNFFIQFLNS